MTDNIMDSAEILRQLKQEVREQYREQYREEWFSVPLSRMTALEEVHSASWVNPHQPIAWPHWPKGLWPKVVAVVQKVIRRLLQWYITPIVEEQNRFNAAVATTLDVLAQENARLRTELHALTASQSDALNQE